MEKLKHMPIGVQHFRDIREQDRLYVDKTQIIRDLLVPGNKYFLSRPRRFGKSLLLDTIGEMYSGESSEELFKGLWIDGKWDFKAMQRPVLRFLFASSGFQTAGLETAIQSMLLENAALYDVELTKSSVSEKQKELIDKVFDKHGKVVILVDEYDKPIVEYLENDMPKSLHNRDLLRGFYAPLKDLGHKIELLFITGISRFTKTSLFSDLNNLNDLSMDENCAGICGITQEELERDFKPYFARVAERLNMDEAKLIDKLREWYNGYHFHKNGPSVYNPFSLVNFFEKKEFDNYWHQSGMPKFMRRFFRPGELRDFEGEELDSSGLQSFDIEKLRILPLMYQTGYLTIKSYSEEIRSYALGYPNQEVKESFLSFYLDSQTNAGEDNLHKLITDLKRVFYHKEYGSLQERLNNLMEILTYDMFEKGSEKIYHGLMHIAFSLVGMHTESEIHTKNGRCDMMIRAGGTVHVIEIKFGGSAKDALAQVKARGYAQKWLAEGVPVVAFGVNIDLEGRKVEKILFE